MKISIVIPTYNRRRYLKNILQQLYSQKIDNFLCEIIVVVDGSNDGTLEMLADEFPDTYVVIGPGDWWFTKSLNEGFRYAEQLNPDAVLILNDDCEIKPDYLATLVGEYKYFGKKSIVGSITLSRKAPHAVTYSGVKQIKWWRYKRCQYLANNTIVKEEELKGSFPTLTLTARGTLIPYSVLVNLDYFDEKYFPQYGSDDDFALKANFSNIPVKISFGCQLFDNTELTGSGAPRLTPKFSLYFSNIFNKFSPVYILNNIRLAARYGGVWVLPFSSLAIFLGTFYRYFKYKRLATKGS